MKVSIITPTHDARFLVECYKSLRRQTIKDWEWIVVLNGKAKVEDVPDDPRVRVVRFPGRVMGVGHIKGFAFRQAKGDILLELDHDDLLTPDALAETIAAFADPEIGFVYSDWADFADDGRPVTYRRADTRPNWDACGWKFYDLKGIECVRAWEPSAAALSLVFYAPNHLRAWRRSVYEAAGGHSANLEVADDHDLLVRTFLLSRMRHIPKCLYLYRVHKTNTWSPRTGSITSLTNAIRDRWLADLVLRECELDAVPCYDLGGAMNCPEGWTPVDVKQSKDGQPTVVADLREPWPFPDGSVGAFRAVDFLEHIADKRFVMSEIHRCLRPNGWLLSQTPSTDGRGAWQDPTHVSFWNENAFWYWTRSSHAGYIENDDIRFIEQRLFTSSGDIPYVVADLQALKPGAPRQPGRIL